MPRLLIISTTFYPDPAVAGVRMTQWSRHLPEFGWTPTIFCKHHGYDASTELLARDVDPSVAVRYLNRPRSAHRTKKRMAIKRWINRGPLARLFGRKLIDFWNSPALRSRVLAMLEDVQPDMVLTTSPPHDIHRLGLHIKNESGIPWVADFRDPYRIDPRTFPTGTPSAKVEELTRCEAEIYESADGVIHAIPIEHRWARRVYPEARGRMRLIVNGCPAELAEGRVQPERTTGGRLSVRCIGVTGDEESLALAEAVRSLIDQGRKVELRFVGWPPGPADQIRKRLGENVTIIGRVAHPEAIREIAGADVLVGCMSIKRSSTLLLSSKLFEFLSVGVPIVMINPSKPDRMYFRHQPGLRMLTQPSEREVRAAIEWAATPEARPPAEAVQRFIAEHNRRAQSQMLARWLDEIHSGRAAGEGQSSPVSPARS